eukprot:14585569-Alexandrium_andersonii.AAC.1
MKQLDWAGKKELKARCIGKLQEDLRKAMDGGEKYFNKSHRAWCVKCQAYCPTCPDVKEGEVWADVGSPTCTSWSMQGKRLKWLDESNIPLFVWMARL